MLTEHPAVVYTAEQVAEIVELVLRRLSQRSASSAPSYLDNGTSQQPQPCTRMTLSVTEAAAMVGISKPKMYALLRQGIIPSIHAGKKIVIPRQAVIDWLSKGENNGKETCEWRR